MTIKLEFHLTERQQEALGVAGGAATHVMFFGGTRSGKTFLHCRNIMMRALMAPESRHLIARFRFNAAKTSIALDTFPKMAKLCFPGVEIHLDKTDWYFTLPNGSEIWIAGLDDGARLEKILGKEYATVLLNECSQISFAAQQLVLTRLAQKCYVQLEGVEPYLLPLRAYYDCNPPNKLHWTYKLFVSKVDPESGKSLQNPDDYARIQMNPESNAENLAAGYIDQLRAMSAMRRKRFLDGEFADANPNALFSDDWIERWRVLDEPTPDFVRIVVAVDPSGADDENNEGNDPIGIVAAALGTDGNAYVLRDATVLAGPATWGSVACDQYITLEADAIVGETNFGGAMVKFVIKAASQKRGVKIPFKMVTASRGKVQRAEPFSVLYEEGRVRHVGHFRELEEEMVAFSKTGYTGARSPNRADALFWALAELFPSLVATRKQKPAETHDVDMALGHAEGWMG
ncbi:phage terminase large subunit [Burkholderia cepacia]|uniref:phage terminase large subunit n=1 Tax=Burkholderia cepacia TaxID=292 RepID=UPI001CF0F004|nr:phage terminase large subunit [Burkholderia cepacia]MCA7976797.1 phage terminase large subunit [Burkholderia cepacia]